MSFVRLHYRTMRGSLRGICENLSSKQLDIVSLSLKVHPPTSGFFKPRRFFVILPDKWPRYYQFHGRSSPQLIKFLAFQARTRICGTDQSIGLKRY